jgi:hypothetical protein
MSNGINEQLEQIAQGLVSPPEQEEQLSEQPESEELDSLGEPGDDIEEEEPAGTEEEELAYFNQLPDAIGLSADEFYNLKLKLDSGDEMTLSEMKDHFQAEKSRVEQLKQQEAALREREAELAKVQSEVPAMTEGLQKAQGNIYAIEMAWNGLQQQLQQAEQANDTEMLTRVNSDMLRLQQMYGQAQQAVQQEQQKAAQMQQQQLASFIQKQQQALREKVPEWNKEVTQQTIGYLTDSLGLSEQELHQAYDHRFWVLANKARLWDEHSSKVASVKKSVKRSQLKAVPGRKGASQSQQAKQRSEIDKAINQARSDPRKKQDALNALAEGMINGNF